MFLFAWIFCWYHISLPACYNLNPFKTMKKKTNSNTHCFQIICRLCVPFCHFLRKSFPCLFILTLVSTFFFWSGKVLVCQVILSLIRINSICQKCTVFPTPKLYIYKNPPNMYFFIFEGKDVLEKIW